MDRSPVGKVQYKEAGEADMQKFMEFLKDDRGLETVEYAIILGLIVAATIASITAIGIWVSTQFSQAETDLGA